MQPVKGDGALARFAHELRALQTRTAGTVPLAEQFGASRTAVYEALAGKRLPTVENLDRIVLAWGVPDEATRWRRFRLEVESALGAEARLRGEVKIRKTPEEIKFQEALVKIWDQVGRPSRNDWGDAAGLSPRTVAAYLDGSTLPSPRKFDHLISGLTLLCADDDFLEDAVLEQGATMREEHLYQARIARKEAREQARVLATALPGRPAGSSRERAPWGIQDPTG
ncbi:hypothetical protein J2S54_003656 [Streptomyces sp. DSM 42143]|uniref:hypothetical protein n=1 Tax=Streptomyces sp. DSM 42143 TaxID=2817711 RepID=UPI0027884D9E|nr:hypothetical protein [Streptomyces sp. DSM 42143]MDQ0386836.1 hypothetical protein [Streptomyces sp. DSM 42143]